MPRPMMPAPITAMVRISGMGLGSLLELPHDGDVVGVGFAHVFSEALLLVVRQNVQSCSNTAKRGSNVVDIIHHANEFTTGRHKNSFPGVAATSYFKAVISGE